MLRTGRDPAATLRGRLESRGAYARVLIEEGVRSFVALAALHFARVGLTSIEPEQILPGDVAAIACEGAHFGAIATGRGFVAKIGPGIWWSAVKRERIAAAWRVC